MKVKIIKCDNPIRWYSNKIGKIFEVKQPKNYEVISGVGFPGCINFEDARPLKNVEAKKTPLKKTSKVKAASRVHNTQSTKRPLNKGYYNY